MSTNLSATTPAAPGGTTNVTWQADGQGNVSGHIPTPVNVELQTNGVDNGSQTKLNLKNGTNVTVSNSGADVTIDGPSSLPPTGTAGGDLSGTYPNPTVAQVNGAVVPASQAFVGTDSSRHIVAATAGALPNGTTATTQTQGDGSTKVATDAYVDTGLATKQATLTGTGLARNTGASTELSGDVTTSGSNATTVVKVNGASVPVSATVLGSDGSSQLVSATSLVQLLSARDQANGYPSLDSNTRLPSTELPAGYDYSAATAGSGPYFLGGYGATVVISTGNVTLAPNGANEVTVLMFYLPFSIIVRKVVIDLITKSTTSGIKANFGIYDSSGNKLLESGAFSVGSADTNAVLSNTLGATVTLQSGFYYYAYSCQDNLATFGGFNNPNAGVFQAIITKNANRIGKATNVMSSATLPPTLGTITVGTGVGIVPAAVFES